MGDAGARHVASGYPADEPRTAGVIQTVEALRADGLAGSPHVVAQVQARVGEDGATVCEIAAALTPAQRHGHRALPARLPLAASVLAVGERIELSPREREALVLVVLGTEDLLEPVTVLTGLSHDEIATGPLGAHVAIDAGRITLRDRRVEAWLEATATSSELAAAHRRLSAYHAGAGDGIRAAWHRARGATQRVPDLAAELLPVARALAADGRSSAAFHVAVEAFHHADGSDADEARLVAGESAVCEGWIADAVDWLGSLVSGGAEHRARALPGLVIAETALRGAVPIVDPTAHRPRDDDTVRWRAWARAAGMAAMMSAERGADGQMRMWLAEVRDADAMAKADGAIRDPVVALCGLLSGEGPDQEITTQTLSHAVAAALQSALSGDIRSGLEILARQEAAVDSAPDPFLEGFERTPLAAAYRCVVEVLLRFWQGDIHGARSRLAEAQVRHPMALPFCGLGLILGRRLDLAALGQVGPVTQSMTESLPAGIRLDTLVDRSIAAYLAGAVGEAAAGMQLWLDRGAPGAIIAVPGLEEASPEPDAELVEPRDQAVASELYRAIRTTVPSAWQHEYPAIAERARTLQSPFVRGRVEALLGTTCVIRGDRASGRRHLFAARSLLGDAGADAWRDSVDQRLARLGEQIERLTGLDTVPLPVVSALDPLAACRAAWAPLLTERELQVAMLVVDGAMNRDIADRLGVSIRTIEVHLGRVFGKLEVRGRVELTVLAHRTNRHV